MTTSGALERGGAVGAVLRGVGSVDSGQNVFGACRRDLVDM